MNVNSWKADSTGLVVLKEVIKVSPSVHTHKEEVYSGMALPSAKLRMTKTIVTHSGTFHCDESLACFLLRQTNDFRGASILRTRDPQLVDEAEIVVDVGAVYDPAR